jgi:hypothetical protein
MTLGVVKESRFAESQMRLRHLTSLLSKPSVALDSGLGNAQLLDTHQMTDATFAASTSAFGER